jgi:hypothetical protein
MDIATCRVPAVEADDKRVRFVGLDVYPLTKVALSPQAADQRPDVGPHGGSWHPAGCPRLGCALAAARIDRDLSLLLLCWP